MSEELKPCPFCGGEAKTQSAWVAGGGTGVKCINCNLLLKANKQFETSQEELFYAITAWNTRAALAKLDNEGEE